MVPIPIEELGRIVTWEWFQKKRRIEGNGVFFILLSEA